MNKRDMEPIFKILDDGDYKKAYYTAETYLQNSPYNEGLYYVKAKALRNLERYDEALQTINELEKVNGFITSRTKLEELMILSIQEKYDEALYLCGELYFDNDLNRISRYQVLDIYLSIYKLYDKDVMNYLIDDSYELSYMNKQIIAYNEEYAIKNIKILLDDKDIKTKDLKKAFKKIKDNIDIEKRKSDINCDKYCFYIPNVFERENGTKLDYVMVYTNKNTNEILSIVPLKKTSIFNYENYNFDIDYDKDIVLLDKSYDNKAIDTYNSVMFDPIVKMYKNNYIGKPILEKIDQYINMYSKDGNGYVLKSKILRKMGRFEEALDTLNETDDNDFMRYKIEKLAVLLALKDYGTVREIVDELMANTLSKQTYSFINNVKALIGIESNNDYYSMQISNYDRKRSIDHIEYIKQSSTLLNKDFNIDKEMTKLEEDINNGVYPKNLAPLYDQYFVFYSNSGIVNDTVCNYIKVITNKDTNQIIDIFPVLDREVKGKEQAKVMKKKLF